MVGVDLEQRNISRRRASDHMSHQPCAVTEPYCDRIGIDHHMTVRHHVAGRVDNEPRAQEEIAAIPRFRAALDHDCSANRNIDDTRDHPRNETSISVVDAVIRSRPDGPE